MTLWQRANGWNQVLLQKELYSPKELCPWKDNKLTNQIFSALDTFVVWLFTFDFTEILLFNESFLFVCIPWIPQEKSGRWRIFQGYNKSAFIGKLWHDIFLHFRYGVICSSLLPVVQLCIRRAFGYACCFFFFNFFLELISLAGSFLESRVTHITHSHILSSVF